MAFQRHELCEGIFLNIIPERKFKANLLSLRFLVPLASETAAKNALLFPVLLRGSEKFPNIGSIRMEEESIYDTSLQDAVYKRGDSQILEIQMRLLDNRYAIDGMDIFSRAMALLSDILLHPVMENGSFLADYVESEKEKLIDDIAAQINDKRRYAALRLTEEMFAGDPYGISELGTIEEVDAVTAASLTEAYHKLLKTARIEIFAVGNFDENALTEGFSSLFGAVKRDYMPLPEARLMRGARELVKVVRESQNVTQGRLSLGFYTGTSVTDPDFHVAQMMNAVYGSGAVSKLFMNVREKLSLCYDCHSSLNGQKGYMTVHAGIEFQNEEKALSEILLQLDEMKNGKITEEELLGARMGLLDACGRVGDSAGNLLNWYFSGLMNGKLISPEEKKVLIESVTAEDIMKKAAAIRLDTHYFLCREEDDA